MFWKERKDSSHSASSRFKYFFTLDNIKEGTLLTLGRFPDQSLFEKHPKERELTQGILEYTFS